MRRVESAKAMLKSLKPLSASSTTATVANFEITILSASGIPNADSKPIYVSWRRGSKKKNTGRTKKAICEHGEVEWSDLSEEPIRISCTMTKDPKTQRYEEKSIGFSIKKILNSVDSNKSSAVGHIMMDLSEYAKGGYDETNSFPVVLKSRSHRNRSEGNVSAVKQSKPATLEINITCSIEQVVQESEPREEKMEESTDIQKNLSNPSPTDTIAFGKPLLGQLIVSGVRKHTIPPVLSVLIRGVRENGLERQGIFRLSGRSAIVSEMIKTLNENPENLDLSTAGPHELADCLKKYLRNLPNSLLPDDHYDECLQLGEGFKRIFDSSKSSSEELAKLNEELSQFFGQLPPANAAALRELTKLLFEVQQHSEENKMHTENLATVFAPTIIQKEFDDPARFLIDNAAKVAFTTAMIMRAPQWVPNEDFSEVDAELQAAEDSLPPAVRVHRLTDRIKDQESKIKQLEGVISTRDRTIEGFELQEFVFCTSNAWNVKRNLYQASIDIYDHLKELHAFSSFNSSFLYHTLRGLYLLHRVSIVTHYT